MSDFSSRILLEWDGIPPISPPSSRIVSSVRVISYRSDSRLCPPATYCIKLTRSGSFKTKALAAIASRRLSHNPHSPTSPSIEISHHHIHSQAGHGYGHDDDIQEGDENSRSPSVDPHTRARALSSGGGGGGAAGGHDSDVEAGAGLRSPSLRYGSAAAAARPTIHWLSGAKGKGGGTGDEPGVDVRSKRDEESYGHLKGSTQITVSDTFSPLLVNLFRESWRGIRVGHATGSIDRSPHALSQWSGSS